MENSGSWHWRTNEKKKKTKNANREGRREERRERGIEGVGREGTERRERGREMGGTRRGTWASEGERRKERKIGIYQQGKRTLLTMGWAAHVRIMADNPNHKFDFGLIGPAREAREPPCGVGFEKPRRWRSRGVGSW